ncbi:unnamed protein product [Arctia plantaginis]|uniref:Uncharacterized protein n=1 Tax=Arctia plantaginis TaxID=874455 RepID=A0A8S0ZS43_ARCPL|nr:unnamed protein product [Arctia plantaginis]
MSRNIDDKSTDNEPPKNVLPPDIYTNIHPKVEAAQIPLGGIKLEEREVLDLHEQLVYYHMKPPPVPTPAYPITICCSPKCLRFELIDEPVLAKVGIINCSARPIYMQCCGLWGDKSRLGASWRSYPRNRFWLPPGLHTNVYVRAVPRLSTPVASATSALQIDASHLRDNVTGYFEIPIKTYFLKYKPVCGE